MRDGTCEFCEQATETTLCRECTAWFYREPGSTSWQMRLARAAIPHGDAFGGWYTRHGAALGIGEANCRDLYDTVVRSHQRAETWVAEGNNG